MVMAEEEEEEDSIEEKIEGFSSRVYVREDQQQ